MEMYFITNGECEVLDIAETRVLSKHGAGDTIGDIALFPQVRYVVGLFWQLNIYRW